MLIIMHSVIKKSKFFIKILILIHHSCRFLRRRHRFLMRTNSSSPQQVKSHNVEATQYRKSKKEKVNPKKVAPLPNQFQRGKMYSKKKNIIPSQTLPVFDLDRNVSLLGNNSFPVTEINQKESGFSGKAAVVQPRAPIFDLNQISVS